MNSETALSANILSKLVEAGVPINAIATFAGIPTTPKELTPDAVAAVQAIVDGLQGDDIGNAELQRKLKLWILCVTRAQELGPDYAYWVARHVLEIPGTSGQVWSQLIDVYPWVKASLRRQVPDQVARAFVSDHDAPDPFPDDKFLDRPFDPDMTVDIAIRLNEEWREALAKEMQAKYSIFPAPWLPPAVIGPFAITPISHCADLYREGHATRYWGMWNHTREIEAGIASFYSIRKNQARIGTLKLVRKGDTVELGEIHGFLDPQITSEVMAVVEPWLREGRGLRFPDPVVPALDLDDIRF